MKKSDKPQVYTNKLYQRITYIYTIVLLAMGYLACRMAYSKEHSEVVNRLDQIMIDLNHEYQNNTEDFWRIYMPMFEDRDKIFIALQRYFASEGRSALSPIEKIELQNALKIIMNSDSKIKWIGVYAGRDATNYLQFRDDVILQTMPDDFPFIEDMESKGQGMEIFGSKLIEYKGKSFRSFALCGGSNMYMHDGKIIIGYTADDLVSAYKKSEDTEDVSFYIINESGVIYDSTGCYEYEEDPEEIVTGIGRDKEGRIVYIRRLSQNGENHGVFCIVPWVNMVLNNHGMTPFIVAVVVVFWGISLALYRYTGNLIMDKIDTIQCALHKIGEYQLDYRIPVSDMPEDEFANISRSINELARCLQENIDKASLSKIKQKEAELSELQSKFEPHFLYNTLEIIRGKVCENGDDETADIIVKLAQIFRSFIGSERFITIREEMEFCTMYFSLLKHRYDNEIKIVYDVESEILEYGIIRNLLQPILENYFVHGFHSEKQDNMLIIRGKMEDDNYIYFRIKDNGMGITDERLAVLKNKLETIETSAKSSYGLKNVNKRIKLLYGPDCGLGIERNEEGGVTIEVRIRKLTCKEHEARMYGEDI